MPSSADVRAGGAFVEFSAKGQESVKRALAGIQAGLLKFSATATVIGTAITAPFLNGTNVLSEWGKEAEEVMRGLGVSFEEFDRLSAGFELSGAKLTLLVKDMDKFVEKADAGGEAAQQLLDLGLNLSQLLPMSVADRASKFADAINRIRDPGQRAALQSAVFGRGALEGNLSGGSAGMLERLNRAQELGGVALHSPESLAMAKEYNEALKDMGTATQGLWASIGATAMPIITGVFGIVTDIIVETRKWIEGNEALLRKIFAIGLVITGIGIGVGFIAVAINGPVLLGAALLLTTFLALYSVIEQLDLSYFADSLDGILDALSAGDLETAFEIATLTVELAWTKMVNWLRDGWFSFQYLFTASVVEMIASALASFERFRLGVVNTFYDVLSTIKDVAGYLTDSDEETDARHAQELAARRTREQQSAGYQAGLRSAPDVVLSDDQRAHERERARARGEEGDIQARLNNANLYAWMNAGGSEAMDAANPSNARVGNHGISVQGSFNAQAIRGFFSGQGETAAERAAIRSAENLDAIRESLEHATLVMS